MKSKIGLPFIAQGENHSEILKYVTLLKKEGFVCNLPINDFGLKGTHGDFGMNYVYVNVMNKSFWLGMPGVKFSDYLFDIWLTIDEFNDIYKIIKAKII